MTMNFLKNGRKAFLAGVALTACLGFALNAQAQSCVVTNWDASPNLVNGADNASGNVGIQPHGFKRYGGPCGLKAPFGATPAYVENSSSGGAALDESIYHARFYTFLGEIDTGGSNKSIFTAFDGSNGELFSILYNSGTSELTIRVIDGGGSPSDSAPVSVDANKWHSIEFAFEAGNQFAYSIDRAIDENEDGTIDAHAEIHPTSPANSGVAAVQMGNVDGASGGDGYFDDFDSRRSSFPGRLMVADANNDGTVNLGDVIAARAEHLDDIPAAGQPDCNEDGEVNLGDVICARAIHLSN